MAPLKWYVYILYSTSTGRLYTGITIDPCRRLQQHNTGVGGAKATRYGRPWRIVWLKLYEKRREAAQEECRIKKLTRAKKVLLAGLAA